MITLEKLPYEFSTLEPYIDAETVELHYSKHHQWYATKLNDLINGTEFENLDLETIIKKTGKWSIFNNAAQVRNHTIYWNNLQAAKENNNPNGSLWEAINKQRGSFDAFKQEFINSALWNFGSWRTWLVKVPSGSLEIVNTSNANNPLTLTDIHGNNHKTLLGIDIREHSYYLKYQNRRAEYLNNIRNIINRNTVSERYS